MRLVMELQFGHDLSAVESLDNPERITLRNPELQFGHDLSAVESF